MSPRAPLEFVACALLDHPPITSIAFGGKQEGRMRQTTMEFESRGETITVNCACGRKMVRPIFDEDRARERIAALTGIVLTLALGLVFYGLYHR